MGPRRHPAVVALLAGFLVVSAVELVRTVRHEPLQRHETGLHGPEVGTRDGERTPFRWTRGARAHVLRPVLGPVLTVPVYLAHPDLPPGGVLVSMRSEGVLLGAWRLRSNGWRDLVVYLPSRVAGPPGSGDGTGEPAVTARREPRQGRVDLLETFLGWSSPAPPSRWFEISVDTTFVPAELTGSADDRELGIGVAGFRWSADLPADGLGLYPWETSEDGPFRWTSARADLPVAGPPGTTLTLEARVPHPDAARRPVEVAFFWNGVPVERIELRDGNWHEVRLPAATSGTGGGVLSLVVSRTWNPAAGGASDDRRDLGVGLRAPRWE